MNLKLLSLYEGNININIKNESIVQALSDTGNPIDYLSSQMPNLNHLLLKLKMRIDINYKSINDIYIHYQEKKFRMALPRKQLKQLW
jgi:hypothetical protein